MERQYLDQLLSSNLSVLALMFMKKPGLIALAFVFTRCANFYASIGSEFQAIMTAR